MGAGLVDEAVDTATPLGRKEVLLVDRGCHDLTGFCSLSEMSCSESQVIEDRGFRGLEDPGVLSMRRSHLM